MSTAAPRPRKRQRKLLIDPASVAGDALAAIDALRRELPAVARVGVSLAELGFPRAREVAELDRDEVEDRVERIALRVIEQIARGRGFGFDVPSRAGSNQKYIEAIDRVVLMDRVSRREFLSTASVRKTVITLRVLQILHSVLQRGIHTTKRDIFYTDCKLFKSQLESDAVLDDIACMVGCTRSSLGVVASEKGVVVGCLTYYEGGDLIDCRRVGIGGKAIPPYMEHVRLVGSDAKFILLVEKDAAFNRLAEDRFYNTYPCIIMTAKGQPDVASRLFLRKLRTELGIPVLGLVDSDPYGLKILSVYMSGSKNMSYDSANLTTPDIKWLGLRPSDLERFEIDDQCRLDMTEHDRKTGRELEKEEFIQRNPAWMEELRVMLASKKKAEIQALNSKDIQFLTKVYLPQKLREGDWI